MRFALDSVAVSSVAPELRLEVSVYSETRSRLRSYLIAFISSVVALAVLE